MPSLLPHDLCQGRSSSGHGTTDWLQIGKGVCQGCILSPCLFNYIQSTSCEIPSWMKHRLMPGASVRNSACGKSHEKGGSTYAKAGSSLRSPPGNSRASTPKTRVCLLYCFVLSPTPLTLWGAVPHDLFLRRS